MTELMPITSFISYGGSVSKMVIHCHMCHHRLRQAYTP
jgi:C4-type Zn-finger protein